MRVLLLLCCLSVFAVHAAKPLDAVAEVGGDAIAQRLVELATQQEVPAGDARVARVREQLARAARLTGETETAVAAACQRAARFIFDATRAPATAVDVLEALAARGQGRPMSDTIGRYVDARRNSPDHSHAAALAAMK